MRKRKTKRVSKKAFLFICISIAVLFLAIGVYLANYWNLWPEKSYTAADFGIETVKSERDENNNGVDDYTDILLGAKAYVATDPKYQSDYYIGGYPPTGEGVCTDMIWAALKNAGYNLKDRVDADIAAHPEAYPDIEEPDPNIDFRRVKNLAVFFQRNAASLTTDVEEIAQWQPGDIVVYTKHIAIISDLRSEDGVPYILHHAGQPILEEDALTRYKIVGHYRWSGNFD
ncbi:MAG TPA: DUF1287 domain-containing protein [Clostridiales bacterium]|nr:DUF1287 domain-containing protein [Clostridiales bacterium]